MSAIPVRRGRRIFALALLCGGTGALGAAGVLVNRSFQQAHLSQQRVQHTRQVQAEINLLVADFIEADAAWRRSDGPDKEAAILREMQNLRQLTADSPAQQANLTDLERLRVERLHALKVTDGAEPTEPAANPALQQDEEAKSLAAIRRTLAWMSQEEGLLLTKRQEAQSRADAATFRLVTTCGVSATLLFISAVAFAFREMLRQEASEKASFHQAKSLQAILDSMGEGVLVAEPGGTYTLINRAAQKILHMRPEQLPKSLAEANLAFLDHNGANVAGSEAPLARALRGEETNEIELHVHHAAVPERADSARMVLSVSGRPIEWEGGRLGGVVVFRDVTQRRRAEDEIREQGDKLAAANAELERRNQEIADFYRTLSHELKTPLTSTREFVGILRDGLVGPVTERQKEYLDLAKQGCDQMTRYINDLLDLSRWETGKLDVRPEPAELRPVLEAAAGILRPAMAMKRIQVSIQVSHGLPEVLMDRMRVAQVLINILSNATKYTPERGEVLISAQTHGTDRVAISVANTGPRIEPEHLQRIFDRLFQIRKTDATVEGGLGLGLYICKQIVAAHGGQIYAENLSAGGVRFTLTLRRKPLPEESAREAVNAGAEKTLG